MDNLETGLYEKLLNVDQKKLLASPENTKHHDAKKLKDIDYASSEDILSNYVRDIVRARLKEIKKDSEDEKVKLQIEECNEIISSIVEKSKNIGGESLISDENNFLLSVWDGPLEPKRPYTSLSVSSVFTGGSAVVALYEELKKEIESSDEVYFLVSFIKDSGLNQIIGSLRQFTRRGKLKVLTTTYMGVTEKTALDRIARLPNTEVKISYNIKTTRLHAKAYMFKRRTGYNVAFIGSSNLSKAAISDGMEWNVKLTSQDVPQVIKNVEELYEKYWNSDDFVLYNPDDENSVRDLERALEQSSSEKKNTSSILFDIRPFPYQNQILEDLSAERELRKNNKNLVVAATGTGKTVISAFDYKRCREKGIEKLLFIAHRKEILEKSMETFRAILRDPNFGELCYGGHHVLDDHLFMMINTLDSIGPEKLCRPDYYDYIVVDEVHHGAAKTYAQIFSYFKPKILLGLTATPERMDGLDILQYFNNRISSEIRLAEAINRELIVPFQYYGITDNTDISSVKFINGGLNETELGEIYNHNYNRARYIIDKVAEYVPNSQNIKALGFCVSIEHADFMSDVFNQCGYKSVSVSSKSSMEDRTKAIANLENGNIQFIFTVDLFNEGVDIPSVNLELMIRPTESLTVFIQQLGRGLRNSDGKTELTVLDFVAQADKNYKVYARKLEYMSILSAQSLREKIDRGFSGLPAGCTIELEKKAQEYVLATIEKALNKNLTIRKVKEFFAINRRVPSIEEFIRWTDVDPPELYNGEYTFTRVCSITTGTDIQNEEYDKRISKGLKKLCLMESESFFDDVIKMVQENVFVSNENKAALMLFYTFFNSAPVETISPVSGNKYGSLNEFIQELQTSEYVEEICDLLALCKSRIKFIERDSGSTVCPLKVYASYYSQQIFAAIGESTFDKKCSNREGVEYQAETNTDYFFVTLNKSDKEFSATTCYNDYAINERLFHWESQSTTSANSVTGKRYISNAADTFIFVRKNKKMKGITAPFVFLGNASFKETQGSKPMQIIWEMDHLIPESIQNMSQII